MPAHVLIIEDNPQNLELMSYLLLSFDHRVFVARDGHEGLELVRDEKPDLILCDVQIPIIDGYEVARHLKSHPVSRYIPLLAVTALAMVGDREKALAAGFDGYLPKPIDPQTFIGQVEMFLPAALRSSQRIPRNVVAAGRAAAVPRIAKSITIIIVDVVATNRDLLRSILEPSGYSTIPVSGVDEALALARKKAPDLLLSDLHMPGKSGFELLSEVRRDPQMRHVKVIIHSATFLSTADAVRAWALGVDRFVSRPLEPKVLLEEIEACLKT